MRSLATERRLVSRNASYRPSKSVEDGGIEPPTLGLQTLGAWKYADLPTCTESPFFDGEREIESYRVAACRSATGS